MRSRQPNILFFLPDQHRPHVVSGLGDWCMVFDGRYKLVLCRDKPVLLYDLENDPDEMYDIGNREPSIVERLRRCNQECI